MPEAELRQAKLPIVVGLRCDVELSNDEMRRLTLLIEDEIRPLGKLYPNSGIVLAAYGDDDLLEAARAAAASHGIVVVDLRSSECGNTGDGAATAQPLGRRAGTGYRSEAPASIRRFLARTCHFLIDVSRSRGQRHAANDAQPLSLDEAFDLDPTGGAQLIRVVLNGGMGSEPCLVSRISSYAARPRGAASKDSSTRVLERTDLFNRDGAIAARELAAMISRSAEHLSSSRLAELTLRNARLRDVFALADTLALKYQNKVQLAFRLIFAVASAATICYALFLIFGFGDFLLGPYLVLLLTAYIIFYVSKKSEIHDRYVDYRALAEGIRVQFFWTACGIEKNAADYYLRKQEGDLDWIRQAMRLLTPCYFSRADTGGVGSIEPCEVVEYWISNQKRYFERTLAKARRAEKKVRVMVRVIFLFGVCATAVILFQSRLDELDPYLKAITFMSFLCPAIAAAIVGFANKAGFLYPVKHYSRMLTIYSRAEANLARCTASSVSLIAIALGEEALHENGEWALFRRERAIDEPTSPFKRPWQAGT
jgi:hypothetical protein